MKRISVSLRKAASILISLQLSSKEWGRDGGEEKAFKEIMTIELCNIVKIVNPQIQKTLSFKY